MHPNGHAALVTGGGSGLGRATAARLAALGAKWRSSTSTATPRARSPPQSAASASPAT